MDIEEFGQPVRKRLPCSSIMTTFLCLSRPSNDQSSAGFCTFNLGDQFVKSYLIDCAWRVVDYLFFSVWLFSQALGRRPFRQLSASTDIPNQTHNLPFYPW